MARKVSKICLVCGNDFKGTEGKFTCGNACRTAMSRMLANGKKPEYWILAKSKGQKIPLFFPKGTIKKREQPLISKVDFKESSEKSYDAPINPNPILDEPTFIKIEKVLTFKEKIGHNTKLDIQINEEKRKECPKNMHPKLFRMQQDDLISELEKQKL
jgi:hypothetical protein